MRVAKEETAAMAICNYCGHGRLHRSVFSAVSWWHLTPWYNWKLWGVAGKCPWLRIEELIGAFVWDERPGRSVAEGVVFPDVVQILLPVACTGCLQRVELMS